MYETRMQVLRAAGAADDTWTLICMFSLKFYKSQ